MDGAAPGPVASASSLMDMAIDRLRHGWGDAYEFGVHEETGEPWARRRDGLGELITAGNPDQLWALVRADYDARPVPRDLGGAPPDGGGQQAPRPAARGTRVARLAAEAQRLTREYEPVVTVTVQGGQLRAAMADPDLPALTDSTGDGLRSQLDVALPPHVGQEAARRRAEAGAP